MLQLEVEVFLSYGIKDMDICIIKECSICSSMNLFWAFQVLNKLIVVKIVCMENKLGWHF